jgi:hypothetical protein
MTAFVIWWIYAFVDETGVLWSLSEGKYGHETADQIQRAKALKEAETSGSSTNSIPAWWQFWVHTGGSSTNTPTTLALPANAPAGK